jgi:pimeloyl-ACP methyl ester carboxylesterase
MVRFVGEVADALELDAFAVGGNSMGGRIAARFMEEHSARVTQLILIDSGGLGKRGAPVVEFVFSVVSKPVLARPLLNIVPHWLVVMGVDQAVSRKAALSDGRINAFWDLNHMEGTRNAIILRLRTTTSSVREHLHEIEVPTLIQWGEEDRIVPVQAAYEFHAAIRNSKLVIYPKTGHLPQEEMADESAADVRAFLTQNARS